MGPGTAEEGPRRPRRKTIERTHERFPLASTPGELLYKGRSYPFNAVDISLGGCCVCMERPFVDGALAHVSISLSISGISLRIGGVTQWTRSGNLVGIRFIHPSSRSRNLLASFLTCLVDKSAVDVIREVLASTEQTARAGTILIPEPMEQPEAEPQEPLLSTSAETSDVPISVAADNVEVEASASGEGAALEDSPAFLHLVKANVNVHGALLDLAAEGCRFRCAERFSLDLLVQVELHLRAFGLYVQLPAVVHDLDDGFTADVRFVQLSPHKQEELAAMIAEIQGCREDAA